MMSASASRTLSYVYFPIRPIMRFSYSACHNIIVIPSTVRLSRKPWLRTFL